MGQTIPMGFRSHTEQKSSASKTVNIFISPFSCYLHPKCKKALQRRRFDLKIGISWFRDCCCSLQLCSQPCVIQSHSCPIMEPGKASSSLCLVSLLLTELLWLWLLLLFGPVCVSMLLKLRDFSAFLRYCKNATGPVIYFSKANTHTCATKKTKQKWKKIQFPALFCSLRRRQLKQEQRKVLPGTCLLHSFSYPSSSRVRPAYHGVGL